MYIKSVRGTRDAFLQLLCYVQECLEWPVIPWRGVIKYNLTLLGYFLFPRLLCPLFVFFTVSYLLIIFQSFSLFSYFATDFWPSSSSVSKEVLLLPEKMKFAALAFRASGTSLSYTIFFNRLRSFTSTVLVTSRFPVKPVHCALFLQYLLDLNKSVSTVNCAFYAFKWLHDLAALFTNKSPHRDSS